MLEVVRSHDAQNDHTVGIWLLTNYVTHIITESNHRVPNEVTAKLPIDNGF